MSDELEDELRRMLAARGDAVDSHLSGASIRERAARRHDDPRHRVLMPAAAGALLAVAALVTPFLLLRGTAHPTHTQPPGRLATPAASAYPHPAPPVQSASPLPRRSTHPSTGASTLPNCLGTPRVSSRPFSVSSSAVPATPARTTAQPQQTRTVPPRAHPATDAHTGPRPPTRSESPRRGQESPSISRSSATRAAPPTCGR